MSLESGLAFFLAILIFSVTPGPGVFAILARAMTQGSGSCFALALGMAISDIVYLVLACFGLAAIAENYGVLFTIIRIAGAVYLVYLGYKMWVDRSHLMAELKPQSKRGDLMGFVQGFLISASNPKVILFYIAFLPTFMDLSVLTMTDIFTTSVLCFVGIMMGLMSIAVGAAWARRYFQSEKSMTGLNRVAGSIMMFAGVYIGTKS